MVCSTAYLKPADCRKIQPNRLEYLLLSIPIDNGTDAHMNDVSALTNRTYFPQLPAVPM